MRNVESIVRTYLRNRNQYINRFIISCFWKSFGLLPTGLVSKKSFCIGHPFKEFMEERSSVKDMNNKCRALLLQEHCKKRFSFNGQFVG